jgi:hypothetical protein
MIFFLSILEILYNGGDKMDVHFNHLYNDGNGGISKIWKSAGSARECYYFMIISAGKVLLEVF